MSDRGERVDELYARIQKDACDLTGITHRLQREVEELKAKLMLAEFERDQLRDKNEILEAELFQMRAKAKASR